MLDKLVRKYPLQTAGVSEQLNTESEEYLYVPWPKLADYCGKNVRIRGKIQLTHNTGKICFLNFSENYSSSATIVIFSSKFRLFPRNPENYYLNKNVEITGRVKKYKGKPEIILNSPDQIKITD